MGLLENMIDESKKRQEKEKERRKWKIGLTITIFLFLIQFLYFNETANRPFLTFRYVGSLIILKQIHIELDANGKPYEDKSRKDIMVPIEIKSTGGMPANITCTDIYLDYKGHPRQRIIRSYKKMNISPVQPVRFRHTFMILNEGLNDFTIETVFYYYGRKFFGWWYLGRPYRYYCKARCSGRYFEILESKDER